VVPLLLVIDTRVHRPASSNCLGGWYRLVPKGRVLRPQCEPVDQPDGRFLMILVYLLQSLFCSQFESVDISVPPNDRVQRAATASVAPPLRLRWNPRCTPDMGMSLWGESPLWEDPMSSG
jgi:hypothetical protein